MEDDLLWGYEYEEGPEPEEVDPYDEMVERELIEGSPMHDSFDDEIRQMNRWVMVVASILGIAAVAAFGGFILLVLWIGGRL